MTLLFNLKLFSQLVINNSSKDYLDVDSFRVCLEISPEGYLFLYVQSWSLYILVGILSVFDKTNTVNLLMF